MDRAEEKKARNPLLIEPGQMPSHCVPCLPMSGMQHQEDLVLLQNDDFRQTCVALLRYQAYQERG